MQRWAFEGLEPCDGKLSRTVLRGKGGRKAPALPGVFSGVNRDTRYRDKRKGRIGFLWDRIDENNGG